MHHDCVWTVRTGETAEPEWKGTTGPRGWIVGYHDGLSPNCVEAVFGDRLSTVTVAVGRQERRSDERGQCGDNNELRTRCRIRTVERAV